MFPKKSAHFVALPEEDFAKRVQADKRILSLFPPPELVTKPADIKAQPGAVVSCVKCGNKLSLVSDPSLDSRPPGFRRNWLILKLK